MKKLALILLAILAITVLNSSISEGAIFVAGSPATGDVMEVLSASSIDGYSHGVITFNDVDQTAFAVVLDPYGVPDSIPFGYAYLFADYFYHQLWGSNDGVNWVVIGSI